MDKTRILIIAVIALFLLNFSTLGYLLCSKPGMSPFHDGPPKRPDARDFIIKELGMNEQQVKDYEKLIQEHSSQMKEIDESMKKSKDEFWNELPKGGADSSKINMLADNIAKNEKQRDISTFRHFEKVRALLDESQKKKFDEIIKDVLRMMGPKPPPPPDGKEPRDRRGPPDGERPPPDKKPGEQK